jgi:opacity protein-like surface antigen
MRRLILALLLPACAALAGPISIGVKGGVPFSAVFDATTSGNLSYVTNNKYWTVGPELDLNLPLGFAIEFNALYRRVNYESSGSINGGTVTSSTTANSWDFPLLLKWRILPGPIRPYFSVGPTFRNLSNFKQVSTFFTGGQTTTTSTDNPPEIDRSYNVGFTVGGGVQLLKHISPELRYTRWGWNNITDVTPLLSTKRNQVEFLLGITF